MLPLILGAERPIKHDSLSTIESHIRAFDLPQIRHLSGTRYLSAALPQQLKD